MKLRHAMTHAVYSGDSGGLVLVEDGARRGYYTAAGLWRSGDQFDVDVHLCGWIAGPRVDAQYDKPYKSV